MANEPKTNEPKVFYPMLLAPMLKETIWGARNLERLGYKILPPEVKIGETWEASDHSHIVNGQYAGLTVSELVKFLRTDLLGESSESCPDILPFMTKLIDANDQLSVQAHPNDAEAKRLENFPRGKTEAWYVLAAEPQAQVVLGLAEHLAHPEHLRNYLSAGNLSEALAHVPVRTGDVVYLPAGTVHALGKGIVVYEISQNCDITYRLYDWDRVDHEGKSRQLHVEKTIAVAKHGATALVSSVSSPAPGKLACISPEAAEVPERTALVSCEYFTLAKITLLPGNVTEASSPETFRLLTILSGSGTLEGGQISLELQPGASILLPSALGNYTFRIKTPLVFLEASLPTAGKDRE